MGSDLPMRWTYAGDLDDMVKLYPWPNIEASNKRALDVRLALSAVTGTPMLLNDGYLILNPACFDSLSDPNSPLRVLINQRYVRVLSRNKSPSLSLSQVVIDGAKQGIGSYRELFADKKRWTVVQKVLDPLQKDLKKENLCGWPRVNLSLSYLQLIRRLAQIPYEQRGLDVPDRIFQDVVNRFDHDLSQDPSKPRSRWEEIVKKVGQAHFQSLMQLANEVYHHNFGVAMTASPPKDDLPEGSEIAVQTRISSTFMHLLYKTNEPILNTPESIPPQLTLPGGVDYSNGNSLVPLFVKEQPLGEARANYLDLRTRYLAGKVQPKEMAESTDEYQQKLNGYFLANCPHGKLATHLKNAAVNSTATWLSVAGIVTNPAPSIVLAIAAFFASEFDPPTFTEKWRIPQKAAGLFKRSARLKKWNMRNRGALTALAVNQDEAQRLVGPLPKFD